MSTCYQDSGCPSNYYCNLQNTCAPMPTFPTIATAVYVGLVIIILVASFFVRRHVIKNRSMSSGKIDIILIVVLLLVVGGGGAFFYFDALRPYRTVPGCHGDFIYGGQCLSCPAGTIFDPSTGLCNASNPSSPTPSLPTPTPSNPIPTPGPSNPTQVPSSNPVVQTPLTPYIPYNPPPATPILPPVTPPAPKPAPPAPKPTPPAPQPTPPAPKPTPPAPQPKITFSPSTQSSSQMCVSPSGKSQWCASGTNGPLTQTMTWNCGTKNNNGTYSCTYANCENYVNGLNCGATNIAYNPTTGVCSANIPCSSSTPGSCVGSSNLTSELPQCTSVQNCPNGNKCCLNNITVSNGNVTGDFTGGFSQNNPYCYNINGNDTGFQCNYLSRNEGGGNCVPYSNPGVVPLIFQEIVNSGSTTGSGIGNLNAAIVSLDLFLQTGQFYAIQLPQVSSGNTSTIYAPAQLNQPSMGKGTNFSSLQNITQYISKDESTVIGFSTNPNTPSTAIIGLTNNLTNFNGSFNFGGINLGSYGGPNYGFNAANSSNTFLMGNSTNGNTALQYYGNNGTQNLFVMNTRDQSQNAQYFSMDTHGLLFSGYQTQSNKNNSGIQNTSPLVFGCMQIPSGGVQLIGYNIDNPPITSNFNGLTQQANVVVSANGTTIYSGVPMNLYTRWMVVPVKSPPS